MASSTARPWRIRSVWAHELYAVARNLPAAQTIRELYKYIDSVEIMVQAWIFRDWLAGTATFDEILRRPGTFFAGNRRDMSLREAVETARSLGASVQLNLDAHVNGWDPHVPQGAQRRDRWYHSKPPAEWFSPEGELYTPFPGGLVPYKEIAKGLERELAPDSIECLNEPYYASQWFGAWEGTSVERYEEIATALHDAISTPMIVTEWGRGAHWLAEWVGSHHFVFPQESTPDALRAGVRAHVAAMRSRFGKRAVLDEVIPMGKNATSRSPLGADLARAFWDEALPLEVPVGFPCVGGSEEIPEQPVEWDGLMCHLVEYEGGLTMAGEATLETWKRYVTPLPAPTPEPDPLVKLANRYRKWHRRMKRDAELLDEAGISHGLRGKDGVRRELLRIAGEATR